MKTVSLDPAATYAGVAAGWADVHVSAGCKLRKKMYASKRHKKKGGGEVTIENSTV